MPKLSVTIVTLNEAEHITAAIASVSWADEVIVVDAGSTDDTREMARRAGARVFVRPWSGWVDQKNHAADLAACDWILSLDADERVPQALAQEIQALLVSEPLLNGYRMPRVTFHLGRWIRTTDFYPDFQTRLYNRRASRWRGRHVHESVQVNGQVGTLSGELQHYSFRDLEDQIDRISRYSTLAAKQMHESGRRAGPVALLVHPVAAFLRNYFLRRGFMDGSVGLTLSLVNAWGVFLKLAKLWELERAKAGGASSATRPGPPEPSAAPCIRPGRHV